MFNRKSSNADIIQHDWDWAQRDRAALLRSLHAGPAPRVPAAASSGWGTDVAGSDPRSVHAYLAGKGDLRTTWWNCFSTVYMAVVPAATLERAMFAFHRFHHSLTLARLGFAHSVAQTAADIEQNGVLAATHNSVVREMTR
jgi:hypothetical protein